MTTYDFVAYQVNLWSCAHASRRLENKGNGWALYEDGGQVGLIMLRDETLWGHGTLYEILKKQVDRRQVATAKGDKGGRYTL